MRDRHTFCLTFSERISAETEKKIKEIEDNWQTQVTSLSNTLELVKDQMEKESQQKVESLIEQHRTELGKTKPLAWCYLF